MRRLVLLAFCACTATCFSALSPREAASVPFRPDVLASLRAEGRLASIVAISEEARRERGLDRPVPTALGWTRNQGDGLRIADRNSIVLLVDFSDNQANEGLYPPSHYVDMLFSVATYPTGSMRDWYHETSYGTFDVTGQVTIWLRMPQTYAYYVAGQAGFGQYPNNAQKLAEDAVAAADPYVDFSQFDNDGPDGIPDSGDDDGYVDALFVVHAGPGREETGSDNDIHSHAWNMVNPVNADGTIASSYSMEPDTGKRGVFGHEFGHVLGLPDLYDTDYSSSGVGDWCMMSFGSWGGGGLTPVHFMAWCRGRLGFIDPIVPLTNLASASIPQIETSPTAYHLWTGGYPEKQYFVVENRQRVGSDVSLPGTGILICHVDENASGNTDEDHPLVMVEQADGLNELANGGASDTGDPWPGSTANRNFTSLSTPNSRDYDGNTTQVAVRNITDSSPLMTANLDVESAPILVLESFSIDDTAGGNGDGIINAGETWEMPITVFNRGFNAFGVTGSITTNDADVTIEVGSTSFGNVPAETAATGTPAFRISLGPNSTDDGIPFTIQIRDALGHVMNVAMVVGVNDPLNIFQWTHDNVTVNFGDQWHVSSQRNHTPGGSYAWKCGAAGDGVYANSLDAGLVTIPLPLATVQGVRFHHWIDAEDDANWTAWDGGFVEARVDGGPWSPITPEEGYPYTIIANPACPFPEGTPVWSGTFDWTPATFDLTGFIGTQLELRFRFGSDGFVTQEGWYVDDVEVNVNLPEGVDDWIRIDDVMLGKPAPNPASGPVTLSFRQPAGRPATLTIVDLQGREVARWDFAPGADGAEQRIEWRSEEAPSGVYFALLRSIEGTFSRKILISR